MDVGDNVMEGLNSASFMKRAVAQLIDMFIVGIIIGIVTIGFSSTRIEELEKESFTLMESYTSGDISTGDYVDSYMDIMYDINKTSVSSNLVYLVVCVGYFWIFQFMNKGASIGKKLMHIRVVSLDGSDISFLQMFVRSSIINEILPMSMLLILVMFSGGVTFFVGYSLISFIQNIFVIICIFMILYRSDKLGLHDMMSKSMVIEERI